MIGDFERRRDAHNEAMSSKRNVTIRYFAVLREQRGLDRESVQTECVTLRDLYRELAQAHGLRLDPSLVRFAVNGEFVPEHSALIEGSEVALIPPVAGG